MKTTMLTPATQNPLRMALDTSSSLLRSVRAGSLAGTVAARVETLSEQFGAGEEALVKVGAPADLVGRTAFATAQAFIGAMALRVLGDAFKLDRDLAAGIRDAVRATMPVAREGAALLDSAPKARLSA